MKSKKIFMLMALLVIAGAGISYQNCGGLDSGQLEENESNINVNEQMLRSGDNNKMVLTLKDGTKINLIKRPKPDVKPMTLTLKDGTIIKLLPRN